MNEYVTKYAYAKYFAMESHNGQLRKYTRTPYIEHPIAVAKLVAGVTDDQEMIAAALLHDVVEDTPVTMAEIELLFGARVAALVRDLTDVSVRTDGNRVTRKAIDRAHIAAASADAKTIKLADLIDNSYSIVEYDPKFARVYMAEKRLLLGVLTDGHPTLWQMANEIIEQYYNGDKK